MWKQSDKRISFLLFDFYINFIIRRYVKKNKYEKKWNYDFKLCFPDRSGKKKSRSNEKLDRYKTNLLGIQRWKREKNIWRRKYGSLSRNKISKIRSETRDPRRGEADLFTRRIRGGVCAPVSWSRHVAFHRSLWRNRRQARRNRASRIERKRFSFLYRRLTNKRCPLCNSES